MPLACPHLGTHDGQKHGLVCTACHDALVGLPRPVPGKPVFPRDAALAGPGDAAAL